MKKRTKWKKIRQTGIGAFSVLSIVGLVASCGAGSTVKKDKNGNPLVFSVTDENGNKHNEQMAAFLKNIAKKNTTSSEEFTSAQNQLYKFLYTDEQKASEDYSKKMQDKSLKLDTLSKQKDNAQKFFDDEKKSYQQTYRDKWEKFWTEHLLTTYHAQSEDQAVENKMAETIKSDALRRFQLQITDDKDAHTKYTKADRTNLSYLKEYHNYNSYLKNDNSNLEVMITKSFNDAAKNPFDILNAYNNSTNKELNSHPEFVSHWLLDFKQGATGGDQWTVTKDTLKKLYSTVGNNISVAKGLFDKGMNLTSTDDSISSISQRSKYMTAYANNGSDGDGSGVLGNIFAEEINQNIKPGFGIGLVNGLGKDYANLPKLGDLKNPSSTGNNGLFNILTDKIRELLGYPTAHKPLVSSDMDKLTDTQISSIGATLRDVFSDAGKGRSLTYRVNVDSTGNKNNTYVLISSEGMDFVTVKPLNPFDPNTNYSSTTKDWGTDPSTFSARIQNDLKNTFEKEKLHFDVSSMISNASSKGMMINYPLESFMKNSKFKVDGKTFQEYLTSQINYSKEGSDTKFNQGDVDAINSILKNANSRRGSLVGKNAAIYKWISDYHDANVTGDNPLIDPTIFTNDEIKVIYQAIVKAEDI